MEWSLRPIYLNWFIWLGRGHGRWLASVAPIPLRQGVEPEGPGVHLVEGDFATALVAEEAARQFIARRTSSDHE